MSTLLGEAILIFIFASHLIRDQLLNQNLLPLKQILSF